MTNNKLITLFLFLLTLSLIVGFYKCYHSTNIVMVDLSKIIDAKVKSLQRKNLPAKEVDLQSRIFARELQGALITYAKAHRVIVVPKEAVVAGGVDITQKLIDEGQIDVS